MATALDNVRRPRPERKDTATADSKAELPTSGSPSVTMSPANLNHWNGMKLPSSMVSSTTGAADSDHDERKNRLRRREEKDADVLNQPTSLNTRDINDSSKTNTETRGQELQPLSDVDYKMENALLIKQTEELKEKITRFEKQTKRLEEERKKEHREYKNQLSKQKKKMKTLAENIRSKEESVIPGLMKKIEERELELDECRKEMTNAQQEANALKEQLGKCSEDLSRTTEERDIVTTELKGHICDTGRITNEMTEVLSVRENMAKQYYQEKCRLLNQIEMLQIESRRKQHLIDRLVARVDILEANRPPNVAAVVDVMQDPQDLLNPNVRRNRVTRWCYSHVGAQWQIQVGMFIIVLTALCAVGGVVIFTL